MLLTTLQRQPLVSQSVICTATEAYSWCGYPDMTLPADIRVNTSVPFPALVRGAGAIEIGKSNGIWTVGLDQDVLEAIISSRDTSSSRPVWNAKDKYSLDNTGQTDNAAALAQMAADLGAIAATLNFPSGSPGFPVAQPMPKVIFEPGVYAFSTWPNFAFHNLWMEGYGQVELWYRGGFATGVTGNVFGNAMTFDAGPIYGATVGAVNITFINFRIVPSGTAADTLTLKSINHSRFDNIRIEGASFFFPPKKCLNMVWCVCTNFTDLHISSIDNVTSVTPVFGGGVEAGNYGVYIDELFPGSFWCSACSFDRMIIEGPEWGVYIKSGGAMSFRNGTIEGCGTAITIESPNGNCNRFHEIDIEANTVDVNCMAGSNNNAIFFNTTLANTIIDNGTNNYISNNGSDFNQPLRPTFTPSSAKATIDASGQAGISIANGANAPVAVGQGVLAVLTNMTSTATYVGIIGGGGVGLIFANAGWVDNTTTPGGGLQSIAFGGADYRIYNNTGGTKIYKVQTFRTG